MRLGGRPTYCHHKKMDVGGNINEDKSHCCFILTCYHTVMSFTGKKVAVDSHSQKGEDEMRVGLFLEWVLVRQWNEMDDIYMYYFCAAPKAQQRKGKTTNNSEQNSPLIICSYLPNNLFFTCCLSLRKTTLLI